MTTTSTSRRSSSSRATSRRSSGPGATVLGGGTLGLAEVLWTGRAQGDLGPASAGDVADRRRAVHAGEWSWLRQVHGATVRRVDAPGGVQGAEGDALVSASPGVALAVFTADCAPVAFASPERVVGIAHAGWRGLDAGILTRTASAMRALGATTIVAALGPCIHPCCYAFGVQDLRQMARRFGGDVVSVTTAGRPALDLPAAVARELAGSDVSLALDAATCTACSTTCYSHRARRDRERQATLVVAAPARR